MGRYDDEFTRMFAGLEKTLEQIDDPHHRRILKNYRLHGLLEVAGRYDELLAPEMTVEHPHYRLHEGGESIVLDGMDQVRDFYAMLTAADALVMWIVDQDVAVADWGFAAEVRFRQFVPGAMLGDNVFADLDAGSRGERDTATTHDADVTYLVERTLAFVWPYDEDGRLRGEHVYEDAASRIVHEVDPADVITAERAAELLAPEIAKAIP